MTGVLGVPPLDKLLGKVPAGSRILLSCDPGTDGQGMLMNAAANLLAGGTVVFLTWSRAPARVRDALRRSGVTDKQLDDHLIVVDAHSGAFRFENGAAFYVDRPDDLSEAARVLRDIASREPKAWLVIDSIDAFEDPERASSDARMEFYGALGDFRGALALVTEWPFGRHGASANAFDAVLRLRAVEQGVVRNQAFSVQRLGWRQRFDDAPRLVSVQPEGVRVQVPKLIVTGPPDAGKTTFIHATSQTAVSVERNGTTVALDRGQYDAGGVRVELWGTPGQKRFDPLLANLFDKATGAIILVDAADPASIPRAKELLLLATRRGLRLIVLANKQDRAGAKTPDQLRAALDLPASVPVLPCQADDSGQAKQVLDLLLRRILKEAAAP